MIVRERETPQGLLVSVCDDGLIGESFEDGDVSITVTESFYGGESRPEEAVVEALDQAAVANIVGNRSITVAIEAGIVDEDCVLDIGEVRHAQVLNLSHSG